jgi:hypothetical protein
MDPSLDERLALQVDLALTAKAADRAARREQEIRARRLGLTGAEIDAARAGNCFDVRAAAAVAFALAIRHGDDETAAALRDRAPRLGLGLQDLDWIEAAARKTPER